MKAMQIDKPTLPPRVYVTVTDKQGGKTKSKSITIYNTTPEQFIEHVRAMLVGPDAPKPRRGRRPAVAA
jgi:hypothetical protein